ncbi:MAG: type III-B CRISPR module RAMP protein Cmr1 [Marinosulfonomonas sp.]|nr:type III-B CRISPR module RAMP protein Cmr1 [Marinosulfonomonas sp.]
MGAKKFSTITAEFEIVTPMFLGGADHEVSRIRIDSIKGALVFWWQALNFARFVDQENSRSEALKKMRTEVVRIFGGPDNQGAVLPRLLSGPGLADIVDRGAVLGSDGKQSLSGGAGAVGVGAQYLGYGLFDRFRGNLGRSCFRSGLPFKLVFILRNGLDSEDVDGIVRTLKLFGMIGGLGSRTRRGWGSIALKNFVQEGRAGELNWTAPATLPEYKSLLQGLLEYAPQIEGSEFRLSAFAKESRVWISEKSNPSAVHALDNLGRAFLNYRARGPNGSGRVGDQPVQMQFKEDHDWFCEGSNDVSVPYRAAFGLPQNYFSKNTGKGSVTPDGKPDRRGSPMFFHIARIGDGFFPVVTLLPTKFLLTQINVQRPGHSANHEYDIQTPFGKRSASGLDVLLDFAGKGPGTFNRNQVLSFGEIWPASQEARR